MDYSAFNSGFGDPEEESPFASQPSTQALPTSAHRPLSSSALFGNDDDSFQTYSPVPQQHSVFSSVADDHGFGASLPYSDVESPRLNAEPDEGLHDQVHHNREDDESEAFIKPDEAINDVSRNEAPEAEQLPQQHEQRHQTPARYKSQAQQQAPPSQQQYPPQQQQQNPSQQRSQYHLQAKITGLERSGRKDPIHKFDVHVRHTQPPQPRLH